MLLFPHSNHAGKMRLKNGQTVNYGSIRVKDDLFYYYTGKGLREIFKPNQTEGEKRVASALHKKTEAELITSEHIARIPVIEISKFIS